MFSKKVVQLHASSQHDVVMQTCAIGRGACRWTCSWRAESTSWRRMRKLNEHMRPSSRSRLTELLRESASARLPLKRLLR